MMRSNGNIDIRSMINQDLMYCEEIILMSSITFSFSSLLAVMKFIMISDRKKKSKKYIKAVNESLLLRSSENARLIGVMKHERIMQIVFKTSHI
jgi:hypothetical protein